MSLPFPPETDNAQLNNYLVELYKYIEKAVGPAALGGTGQDSYTKGDLLVGNAAAELGKLGVGANDTFLIADSNETLGMRWAAVLLPLGATVNLAMRVSGSTLTISGDGGTALSASNPGYAAVRDTSGDRRIVKFTANVTVTFGASSDTDGNLFGISNVNWSEAMPHFLGIIWKSASEYEFCFGRVPNKVSGPAATDLAQLGDTDADSETDTMILNSGLTLSGWAGLPITQLGWWKATYASSGSAWTFSVDQDTGFNYQYEATRFLQALGHFGASSNSYCSVSGGTAPTYTSSQTIYYTPYRNGRVDTEVDLGNSSGGTGGSGGNPCLVWIPYAKIETTRWGFGRCFESGGANTFYAIEGANTGNHYIQLHNPIGGGNLSGADQSSSLRAINGKVNYFMVLH